MESQNYAFFMKEDVSKYSGEWIAICNKQVVSSGPSAKVLFDEAKKKYPKERPFIARVPTEETMIL